MYIWNQHHTPLVWKFHDNDYRWNIRSLYQVQHYFLVLG